MKKKTKKLLGRFTSRKFLTTAAVEVGLLVALFSPEHLDTAKDLILRIGSLVGIILVALGYIYTQGKIDKVEATNGDKG